jgi:hypothetical protein
VLPIRLHWDIVFSDSTANWVTQFVGQAIYVLDYLEGSGQPLGCYTNELRSRVMRKPSAISPMMVSLAMR